MNSGTNISTWVATALLCCTIAASCSREAVVSVDPAHPEAMQVGFRIALGESSFPYDTRSEIGKRSADATRADLDDGTSVDFENYIDLENADYRFLFFTADDRYISSFIPEKLIPLSDNPLRAKLYDVIGQVSEPLPDTFKIVVLANWPQYPAPLVAGRTTIDDICTSASSLYDYRPPFSLSRERLIPMFGVKSCTGMIFIPDMLTYVGTIHLLRAMAKVEVACTTDLWTVDRISLRRYNSRGYCAPEKVYDQSDYIHYDAASDRIDYVEGLHLAGGANDADLKTIPFEQTAPGRYTLYVPEYRNTADGSRRADDAAQIIVTFKEFPDKEYPIEFRYYNNPPKGSSLGDPFDIRRNYYYRFSIVKSAEPDFMVDVFPYEEVELDPGFGILPPKNETNQ